MLLCLLIFFLFLFFFFNDTATTEIYTLSLHDALPISPGCASVCCPDGGPSFSFAPCFPSGPVNGAPSCEPSAGEPCEPLRSCAAGGLGRSRGGSALLPAADRVSDSRLERRRACRGPT